MPGVAQVLDGLGNPLIPTGDSHTPHSALLVAVRFISLPFVVILNTVITPPKNYI